MIMFDTNPINGIQVINKYKSNAVTPDTHINFVQEPEIITVRDLLRRLADGRVTLDTKIELMKAELK